MAERPPKPARVHKSIISDQQKRRDIALQRQSQGRRDLQQHARQVVSLFVTHSSSVYEDHNAASVHQEEEQNAVRIFHNDGVRVYQNEDRNTARVYQDDDHNHTAAVHQNEDLTSVTHENLTDTGHLHDTAQEEEGVAGMLQATRLKGSKAREWFKQQFMLPEWMVDAPLRLRKDWYVMARPAGERCIVVSSNGTTVSRLRNGRILHSFPSALPNGARARGTATSSHVFCILDCIFHKPDSTYYIIDMMCWRGYSLYDCNYEFRHFWIKSKLGETGAFDPPSTYHLYRFSIVPVLECDMAGLQAAYSGTVSFERDGCLFLNRHAHYVLGVTPLALLWKDSVCSRYHIDTDSKGNVPAYQQVVLELKEDGTVATCDDPVCVLGSMPQQFLQQNSQHLRAGMLLRFAIGDQGLSIVNGRPIAADIQYQGLANRFRAGADSVSKVLFQYAARHSPLTISDISKAIEASDDDGDFQMDA